MKGAVFQQVMTYAEMELEGFSRDWKGCNSGPSGEGLNVRDPGELNATFSQIKQNIASLVVL